MHSLGCSQKATYPSSAIHAVAPTSSPLGERLISSTFKRILSKSFIYSLIVLKHLDQISSYSCLLINQVQSSVLRQET